LVQPSPHLHDLFKFISFQWYFSLNNGIVQLALGSFPRTLDLIVDDHLIFENTSDQLKWKKHTWLDSIWPSPGPELTASESNVDIFSYIYIYEWTTNLYFWIAIMILIFKYALCNLAVHLYFLIKMFIYLVCLFKL